MPSPKKSVLATNTLKNRLNIRLNVLHHSNYRLDTHSRVINWWVRRQDKKRQKKRSNAFPTVGRCAACLTYASKRSRAIGVSGRLTHVRSKDFFIRFVMPLTRTYTGGLASLPTQVPLYLCSNPEAPIFRAGKPGTTNLPSVAGMKEGKLGDVAGADGQSRRLHTR